MCLHGMLRICVLFGNTHMPCRQARAAEDGVGEGDWVTAKISSGSHDIVAAVEKAVHNSQYLQCSMRPDADAQLSGGFAALYKMRQAHAAEEWGWQHARGVTDAQRATLLLFGNAGTRTFMHLDITEASNVAFATQQVSFCSLRVLCSPPS